MDNRISSQQPLQIPTDLPLEEKQLFTSQQLLDALFFFWDAFERSTMNFFLIKDTARQVIANAPLEGDKITLGIRRLEWQGGQQRIFKAFMQHEKNQPKVINKDLLLFHYKDVPVELRIYEDNPCLEALNIAFYNYETFNIPNMFDTFCEKYDKQ